MIIAVDFDGTCVKHEYPKVGADCPGARETLTTLHEQGHQILLWTMRSGKELQDAVDWFDIPLLGINTNPGQSSWTLSPKAYAQIYIDDAALGCPLVTPDEGGRPYVDWAMVQHLLPT